MTYVETVTAIWVPSKIATWQLLKFRLEICTQYPPPLPSPNGVSVVFENIVRYIVKFDL